MIVAFTLFDLRELAAARHLRLLLALAFVLAVGAAAPIQGLAIISAAAVLTVFTPTVFHYDERGRLDTLYALSAVTRTAVVIGRTVTLLVLAVAVGAAGFVVTVASAAARGEELDWLLIAVMSLAAFAYLAVAMAVQLPWLFAVGFTRARSIVFVFLIVFMGGAWLLGQTHILDGLGPEALASATLPLVGGIVVAGGTALIAASAALAVHLYNRREL